MWLASMAKYACWLWLLAWRIRKCETWKNVEINLLLVWWIKMWNRGKMSCGVWHLFFMHAFISAASFLTSHGEMPSNRPRVPRQDPQMQKQRFADLCWLPPAPWRLAQLYLSTLQPARHAHCFSIPNEDSGYYADNTRRRGKLPEIRRLPGESSLRSRRPKL